MPYGVFLVVTGLWLVIAPLTAARFANKLRDVPYSTSVDSVRLYRACGSAMTLLGLIIAVQLA